MFAESAKYQALLKLATTPNLGAEAAPAPRITLDISGAYISDNYFHPGYSSKKGRNFGFRLILPIFGTNCRQRPTIGTLLNFISAMRHRLSLILLALCTLLLTNCRTGEKRIVVIHSYESEYPLYTKYDKLIETGFRREGIKASFATFYLDCERHGEKAEIARVSHFLDSVAGWRPDIILLNDDQATYSALKSGHPLMRETPAVFTGVNYPNEELLRAYPNVTGFEDRIDFVRNLRFIAELTGMQAVHTILDYTFLDQKVRNDISDQLKGTDIVDNLDNHLDKAGVTGQTQAGHIVLNAYSIRKPMKNWLSAKDSLVNADGFFWTFGGYNKSSYLQTKFDFGSRTFAEFSGKYRFTVINEMFDCKYNLLGGYLTPLSVQADDLVKAAARILRGASPVDIPVTASRKEYILDWEALQLENITLKTLPADMKIINRPYRVQYPVLWAAAVWGGIGILLAVFLTLIYLYRREARKKRQIGKALADERMFLALAIKGSKTYPWRIGHDGLIFEREFQQAQQLPSATISLERFSEYIHPDYRCVCDRLTQWASSIGERRIELLCDFNGKGYRWWELRYSVVEDVQGRKNITGLLLDIEEYKAREQELIEARELAEQAELKQSFLANMSHEIRTPLNAIVGFSNILASDVALTEDERQQYVDLINSNNELLLKLIGDILDISRIESGYMSFEYASYELRPLLDEVFQTHRMLIPGQLQFRENCDDVPVRIYTDKGRLTQVLTNFISNACKFTREGHIELGYRYLAESREVEIYVEDTGIGIPRGEQKIIFNRFYKKDEFMQGTGLGLSICRVIIEKLHGRIGLVSESGKGSRFSIFLNCEPGNNEAGK